MSTESDAERPVVSVDTRLAEIEQRKRRRVALDVSLAGGLAGYVARIRADHGVWLSGDTVRGCVCDDIMCSKHLLLAWCDELAASYEAKVQDFTTETARSDALAAQLRDARAENERHGECVGCDYRNGPEEFCPRHGRTYSDLLDIMDRIGADRDAERKRADRAQAALAAVRELRDRVANRMMATARVDELDAALAAAEQDEPKRCEHGQVGAHRWYPSMHEPSRICPGPVSQPTEGSEQ